jgi:hypothetical protein
MRALVVAIAVMVSGAAWAAAERLPSFPKNTDYREARRSLIGLGYAPVKLPDADVCEKGDGRCEGFPEMLSCSGTGAAHCVFVWRSKRDMLVEIVTIGEGNAGVYAVRCRANCR